MISNEQLEQELQSKADVNWVKVTGDGYHYHITLVSDVFVGLSRVARQQWVYALLNDYITSGQVHAVNMKTWTNNEWETQHG